MSGAGSIESTSFRPAAPLENLRRRAAILAATRGFFEERGVLEVDTPVLCAAGAVDRHLEPIPASYRPDGRSGRVVARWLVTSPEHSLKRLLAAGSGPIYQIAHAFRDGERGRLHNPEFTILEWYRPGFDHWQLMEEVEALIRRMLAGSALALPAERFERVTYRQAFLDALGFDPHRIALGDLSRIAGLEGVPPPPGMDVADRDAWLNLLLAARVEDTLGEGRPAFLVDYPASQAALARLRPGDPPVAERFELYIRGIELVNGYHELCDAGEQRRRFEVANAQRSADGKPPLPIDERFLAALEHGLPACAGVALGVDRVVMLACGSSSIDEVLAFPLESA